MTAHAFWRLFVTASPQGSYTCFAELELRATIGGTDQTDAGTGTAIASSQFFSARPQNVFDNNGNTLWEGGQGFLPEWVGYHFPDPVNVEEIVIRARGDQEINMTPTGMEVQSSDDGMTWNTEWPIPLQSNWGYGEVRTFARPVIIYPDPPVVTLERLSAVSVSLTGSAYVDADGTAQKSAQWQLTRATDPLFIAPLIDTGESLVNLSSYVAAADTSSALIARARYRATNDRWSAWGATSNTLNPPGTILPDPVVFPFEPDGGAPISETVVYKTNVLSSHNDTEQRVALRRRPTLRVKWLVTTMERGEASRLAGLLWKTITNRWWVPLWMHAGRVTAVNAMTYTVTAGDPRWEISGSVLVWKDSATWDLMTYAASDAGTVTLTGDPTFDHATPGTVAVPVAIGALAPSYDVNRSDIVAGATVEFEVDTTNTAPLTPREPPQTFRGAEVLTIHPDTTGTETEGWTLSSERSGGELGPFVHRAYGPTPVVSREKSWVLATSAERREFRAWLAARRGQKVPLWIPTYQDDVLLAAGAPSGLGWIDIVAMGFADKYLYTSARSTLAVLLAPDTVVPLSVTVANDLGDGVERLFLDDPVPVDIPIGARVSLLVFARLATDEVTMDHLTPDVTTVQLRFVEVPREVPPGVTIA